MGMEETISACDGAPGLQDCLVVNGNVLVVKGLAQASGFGSSKLLVELASYLPRALEW